jgi:hypothetical protein
MPFSPTLPPPLLRRISPGDVSPLHASVSRFSRAAFSWRRFFSSAFRRHALLPAIFRRLIDVSLPMPLILLRFQLAFDAFAIDYLFSAASTPHRHFHAFDAAMPPLITPLRHCRIAAAAAI